MSIENFLLTVKPFFENHQIIDDLLRRLAYGTDASFYRLIPQLVIQSDNENQIAHILKAANQHQIPVTFRAAGTSLSGQAITDSVLITLSDQWKHYKILDEGKRIHLQPGIRGAQANQYLAPLGRKIGPDPASINTAKIGGIAANNASGMCCGTAQNTYHTLHSMRLILADGTLIDTADPESRKNFEHTHGDLLKQLSMLAAQVGDNKILKEKIRHKYRLKNTTGYALNALIDFENPIDILQHLMIGSEGTLGFIAEIGYRTVEDAPFKSSAICYFETIEQACHAVSTLKQCPVAAVELMDWSALNAVKTHPLLSETINHLPEHSAALLIETRSSDPQQLMRQVTDIEDALKNAHQIPFFQQGFTDDTQVTSQFWGIRKGAFPAVGAVRPVGSTVIIEDVAYPLESLAEAVKALQALFIKWEYSDAVIFGHALEGNLHFVFSQAFESDHDKLRYEGLMADVADMTVNQFNGSLKAEHGTGRNMAPFVKLEWGDDAYKIMQQIKQLLDPNNILNPGVILNDDSKVHLQNIKPLPATNPIIDQCIECGFCEPVCPSKDLSLTPRQRIVIQREIARLTQYDSDSIDLKTLQKEYAYYGDETCAGCGLCSTQCPVKINTGDLTRALRQLDNAKHVNKANWVADHFATTTQVIKVGLNIANAGRRVLGNDPMKKLTQVSNKITQGAVGEWRPELPKGNPWKAPNQKTQVSGMPVNKLRKVVYFPSCAARTFSHTPQSKDQRSLPEVMHQLMEKAGFEVIYPDNLNQLCCGMPFCSKGFKETADAKRDELMEAVFSASNHGEWPIVFDTSPCSSRFSEHENALENTFDPIRFALQHLVPNLTIEPSLEPISLHITCSTTRSGIAPAMLALSKLLSQTVFLPEEITCCGFAGDKGFSTPELNASALKSLKTQLPKEIKNGYSSSLTCEIGLSEHSGIPYQSLLYLLDNVSQAKH